MEISLKRTVPVTRWNQSAGKMLGTSTESQHINKKIDETKTLLYKAHDSLLKQDEVITAHLIKARFLGTDQQHRTLTHLLEYHHQVSGALKYGTMKNYFTTENYLKEYLKANHHPRNPQKRRVSLLRNKVFLLAIFLYEGGQLGPVYPINVQPSKLWGNEAYGAV